MHTCYNLIFLRHHAWASFEAMAEIYNEVMLTTQNENALKTAQFLASHPIAPDEGTCNFSRVCVNHNKSFWSPCKQ